MRQVLELAARGFGSVTPNPMVGCVICFGSQVLAEAFHHRYGGPHAEANAIRLVGKPNLSLLKESTVYVNLEPCAHYGKTPPCVNLLIEHRVKEVVIGTLDPNPMVNGKGADKLSQAGIKVTIGVLEEECRELNKRFFTFHEKRRPYVILKWAETADGFMARKDKKPEWISGEDAQTLVHEWRADEMAVMVGTETALHDDPELNVRHVLGRSPIRVVLDRSLRLPSTLNLFNGGIPTVVFTSKTASSKHNLDYIQIDFNANVLEQLLAHLYNMNVQSLLVEGGARVISSFIEAGLWDEARVFKSQKSWGEGIAAPHAEVEPVSEEMVGEDRLQVFRNVG